MSRRSSHSRGSQVLQHTLEGRHTTGSSTNIFMSREDERLQLRLVSPKKTPRGTIAGIPDDKKGHRTPETIVSQRKKVERAPNPLPPLPRRRDEKQTPNQTSDENLAMSPDNIHSPQTSPRSPGDSFSWTPRNLASSASMSSHDIVASSNTTLGLSPIQHTPKTESSLAWQEIQKLRENVWDLRSQIHQTRASLREKQDVKAVADDLLFRRITYMTARGLSLTDSNSSPLRGQKSLAQLMDDCQEARNEYGPLEDDCTRLEDRLSQQEFKLARLEDQFYARAKDNQQPRRISDPSLQDHSRSSSVASDDEDFFVSGYHPLVNEYLSKLGDLDLMQERLDEFRDEKAALEAEKASRHRFGLTLDDDDQDWLDDAEAEHREITDKIHSLEKELEGLKRICLSKNLIDEDGEPTDFQNPENACFVEEEDMSSRDHISEYVKYPLLLPYPGKKHEDNERYEPKPDLASETATVRINSWILDKLHISPLDVNLLASTFEKVYGKTSKDWQFRVLKSWYQDDTIWTVASSPQMPPASQCSSMSTRHPDETSHSSEMSQEQMMGSVHVLLAPSSRPQSVLSDDTERAFDMTRLNISIGIADGRTAQRRPLDLTSRPGWT